MYSIYFQWPVCHTRGAAQGQRINITDPIVTTHTYTTPSQYQWRSQTFIFGGANRTPKARDHLGGPGVHAPPRKFWNLESLKCDFKHFGGEILQNSED
jgi:hypothetical protein